MGQSISTSDERNDESLSFPQSQQHKHPYPNPGNCTTNEIKCSSECVYDGDNYDGMLTSVFSIRELLSSINMSITEIFIILYKDSKKMKLKRNCRKATEMLHPSTSHPKTCKK